MIDNQDNTPTPDPLDRLPKPRLGLLNVMGEMLLDDSGEEEATTTPRELAEYFHHEIEKLFMNKVCDEDGDRENMIGILEMDLKIFNVSGKPHPSAPGFISIGATLFKRDAVDGEIRLTFRWNPAVVNLFP